MLVEVLLIQQGLFEFLPQLVDLTLLLHIVDEILAYLLLQHPLVLILSFVELLLLHLPQVVVVVAVDALVVRQALYLVLDHRDLLLQDGQGDVGVVLLELVGQVAELEADLSIPTTHFNLDVLVAYMLYRGWESRHLQGLLVSQETPEPIRQGFDFCQLLFETLCLSHHLLSIFFALGSVFIIVFQLGLLGLQGLLVIPSFLEPGISLLWRLCLSLEPNSISFLQPSFFRH